MFVPGTTFFLLFLGSEIVHCFLLVSLALGFMFITLCVSPFLGALPFTGGPIHKMIIIFFSAVMISGVFIFIF